MNSLKVTIVSNIVFLVNPFLWFSFGIFEFINNRKYSNLKFSILIGVVGYTIFPWGDGYERFRVFSSAEFFSFFDFMGRGILQGDIVFYLLSYTVYTFGGSYQWVQFFFVFFGAYVLGLSLKHIFPNANFINRIIIFLLISFLINWIGLANNLRYMLATIICLHAIFIREKFEEYKSSNVFFVLAIATHFYALIVFLVYKIIYKIEFKYSRFGFILLAFFSFCLAFLIPIFLNNFISIFVSILGGDNFVARKMISYMLSGDGVITKMIASPAQLINHLLKQLPLLLLVYYFLFRGNLQSKSVKTFIVFFCFTLCFIYYYSVFIRFSYFCLLYGTWVYLSEWKERGNSSVWFFTFLSSSLLLFSLNIVYFQRIIERDEVRLFNANSLCAIVHPFFLINRCSFSNDEIYSSNKQFRALKEESINRTLKALDSNG